MREAPSRVTLVASDATFAGVLIIMTGSMGAGKIEGSLLALFMTFMMSGVIVVFRRWPETTASLPAALSSIIL
jgi:drug/metabolite transporter (DMT)-like permease